MPALVQWLLKRDGAVAWFSFAEKFEKSGWSFGLGPILPLRRAPTQEERRHARREENHYRTTDLKAIITTINLHASAELRLKSQVMTVPVALSFSNTVKVSRKERIKFFWSVPFSVLQRHARRNRGFICFASDRRQTE